MPSSCVALAGLAYAGMLVGQVTKADKGTPRMQEIAAAVREGANAYLEAQFRKIVPLILVITVLLYATKYAEWEFAVGRSGAFLVGSIFSCAGRFVRHDCWPPPATSAWPPPPGTATARPCSLATARAR